MEAESGIPVCRQTLDSMFLPRSQGAEDKEGRVERILPRTPRLRNLVALKHKWELDVGSPCKIKYVNVF